MVGCTFSPGVLFPVGAQISGDYCGAAPAHWGPDSQKHGVRTQGLFRESAPIDTDLQNGPSNTSSGSKSAPLPWHRSEVNIPICAFKCLHISAFHDAMMIFGDLSEGKRSTHSNANTVKWIPYCGTTHHRLVHKI